MPRGRRHGAKRSPKTDEERTTTRLQRKKETLAKFARLRDEA